MKRVFINKDLTIGAVISGDQAIVELNTVRPCDYVDVDGLYFYEQGDYLNIDRTVIINDETKKEFKIEQV